MISQNVLVCRGDKEESNGQFPLDTSLLCYVSATPVEQIGFTLVHVLIPTRSAASQLR